MNKHVLVLAVAAALTGEAYAVEKPDNLDELSPDLQEVWDKMDRVDREDMRTKSGEVDGDTLTLRVEDQAPTRDRDFIYGKDVEIDVSSLNQADEVADLDSRVTDLENAPDFGHEIQWMENDAEIDQHDQMNIRIGTAFETEDGRNGGANTEYSLDLSRFNQQAEVDALDSRVTENESEIDRLTDKTNRHTDRLNNQSDRLQTQKERLNNQSERISNLRSDMQRNDARIESDSIARDEALQDNIDAVDAASRKRDRKQNKKIKSNTRAIAANSARIDQNAADIAANSAAISQNASDIAANSAAIAENSREISRVEDESIARDEAIMDYVIEDQARQDALIADNAAEIDRVEEQSVERDEALADLIDQRDLESIVRDIHLHQRVEREETERALQDDLLREDINKNHQRIVDTNRRIDLAEDRIYQNEMHIDNLYQNVDHLRSDMYSAVAGAAAMAAIPVAPVGRTAIGVGYGNFSGQDAAAFGISHRTESGKHAFTLSGTFTQRDNGVSAGYSYSF